jgi:hypothetical protein
MYGWPTWTISSCVLRHFQPDEAKFISRKLCVWLSQNSEYLIYTKSWATSICLGLQQTEIKILLWSFARFWRNSILLMCNAFYKYQ